MKLFNLAFLLSSLILVGCVEFKNPLCNESNLTDMNGIEGERKFVLFDGEGFDADETLIKFEKKSKGVYAAADGAEFKVCKLGSRYVSESKTPYGTYRYQLINSLAGGGFTILDFFVGKSWLEEGGIQYHLETRKVEEESQMVKKLYNKKLTLAEETPKNEYQVLVIDNEEKDSELIDKYGVGMSVGYSFH